MKSRINKKVDDYFDFISSIPLLCLLAYFGVGLLLFWIDSIWAFPMDIIIPMLAFTVIILLIGSVFFIFLNVLITKRAFSLLEELDTHFEQIRMLEWDKKANLDIEKCEKILSHTSDIYILWRKLAWIARWFFRTDKQYIFSFIESLIGYTMTQIDRTREVLMSTAEEHISKISQAKEDINTHTSSLPELHQTAEVQKARLDRQIEQFEELQKVLVKV